MVMRQGLEAFESNGAFQIILRKPWLCDVQATHRYETDEITIQMKDHTATITNNEDDQGRHTKTSPDKEIHHTTNPELQPTYMMTNSSQADPGEVVNCASPRVTDPAHPERVQTILNKISIGPNLSGREWSVVTSLIKEYPDIFALNLSEVFPVDFVMHKLNINPHKHYQRRYTSDQLQSHNVSSSQGS